MKEYLNHSFDIEDFDLVSIIDELPLWSAPFGLDLLDTVKLKPNMVALDIGSGLGFPMIELALRLGDTGKVFGIDPWERAVERTRLKIKVLKLNNAEVIKGVAEKLPFDNEYFDLIVSNNGINNVEDMRITFNECARVSKKGAQFIITFNLENTMMEFYDVFEEIMKNNNLVDEVKKMKDQIYLKRKPVNEVESLLNESGFKIKDVKHRSFKMDYLDGTTMLNHYMIKYWFLPGWKHVLKEEDQEKVFDSVEKRLNTVANKKGSISLTVPYVTVECIKR